jgi:SpoVK/Ycf46/Vps4 family AAA+-type ATPase
LLTADLRARKMRPPRGVLLVGVPGCGKSLSAKTIALEWKMPLYRLDISNIHGMYVGQSESRLKSALEAADNVSPCILWIDEIEKGLSGSDGSSGVTSRLIGHFLFWLQESTKRVFVVATANDVSLLPAELLRRGRFDELFFVDLPSREDRQEIIQIYLRRYLPQFRYDESLLKEMVNLSHDFAGSDIEAAVKEIGEIAFLEGDESIRPEHLISSFKNSVPLIKTNPERIESIRKWGSERALPASKVDTSETTSKPFRKNLILNG